ncbi:MAG: DUF2157 domain-containing protein [Bacteriovoracaceae bacterium]
MGKIERKLIEWEQHSLINHDQVLKIKDYESKKSSSWFINGVLILGALIVGLGIISIIASNWEDIPAIVKLVTDFLLLSGLAFWTYKEWSNENSRLEFALTAFMMMTLASIGLIAQIYHTGGELWQAILFWTLITSGIAFSSRDKFIPFLWTSGFIYSFSSYFIEATLWQGNISEKIGYLFLFLPFFSGLVSILIKKINDQSHFVYSFRVSMFLTGISGLVMAEGSSFRFSSQMAYLLPSVIAGVFLLFIIESSTTFRKIQKVLLQITVFTYFISFIISDYQTRGHILSALVTLIILSSYAAYLASIQNKKLFQFFLSMIAFRFLVLYFEALGGLARTGFGLIFSGGIVIGVALLWHRYRQEITQKVERWVQ